MKNPRNYVRCRNRESMDRRHRIERPIPPPCGLEFLVAVKCWLIAALCLAIPGGLYSTPPDKSDAPDSELPPTPIAWWPNKLQKAKDIAFPGWAAGAPGLNLEFRPTNAPLRFPIFLVTAADSPDQFTKEELETQVKEAFFGQYGAQAFLNAMFEGKGRLLDRADFFPVTLNGSWNDYLTPRNGDKRYPNKTFIADLAAALKTQNQALDPANYVALDTSPKRERLSRDRLGNPLDELTIDGAFFVLSVPQADVYAYRTWLDQTVPSPEERTILTVNNRRIRFNSCVVLSSFANILQTGKLESIHPGYLSHELLHLFNIPDLYDRSTITQGCGHWCVMSWGMFGKDIQDTRPVWPSAWVRESLTIGLSEVVPITEQRALIHLASGTAARGFDPNFVKIILEHKKLPDADKHERLVSHYLLIELRGRSLPNEKPLWPDPTVDRGFLVWEVDESVGALEPTGRLNPHWPCSFWQKSASLDPGQNDNRRRPLVGLLACSEFAKSASSGDQMELAHNFLSSDDASQFSQKALFRLPDEALTHPLGVTLSNWNPAAGTFTVEYQPALVARLNSGDATKTEAAQSALVGMWIANAAPAASADLKVIAGNEDDVRDQLSENLRPRLNGILKSYPRDVHVEFSDTGTFGFQTQLPRTRGASKDLGEQLSALNRVFGDSVSHVTACSKSAASGRPSKWNADQLLSTLKDEKPIFVDPFVKVGTELVRVTGAYATMKQDFDQDRIITRLVDEVKFPEAVNLATTRFAYTKEEVRKKLKRAGFAVPANVEIEKVLENGSGRLLWQCRIPYADGIPLTLEVTDGVPITAANPIKIH